MAFPPTSGSPLPLQMAFQPPMGAPPFPMHPGRPGLMPMPGGMPLPMGPGPVRLPLQPPLLGVSFVRPPTMVSQAHHHIISAPPISADSQDIKQQRSRVPLALSAADMKVATTVFVGNISDKASDTLVRQILLRCGRIEGWKRVQDASGKLQGFGFCEYADPESTLRALRLLHDFKLGDKNLVVKVDSKTRTDLLKYLTRKKRAKQNLPIDDDTIDKAVAELKDMDGGTGALSQEIDSDMKAEDEDIMEGVGTLVRENIEVLSSTQPSEDVRLKQDVTDALISMAKQAGNVDPDSTLDEVDMEDDMKTLVSDEIKKFRQSYKRDEEKKAARKAQERERRDRVRDRDKDRDRNRDRDRDREKEKERDREKEKERERERPKETEGEKEKPERPHSPKARASRRDRSRSPRRRSRSRSRSRERNDREKRRERDRQREREESLLEEEEHEERMRQRKQRDRDKAYREKLQVWDSRERRKAKEHEKQYEKEDERRGEMDRERRHLAEFLADYDDEKDDQRYYKGGGYARRRRDRELEMEEDERDRQRERREIESLRLEVMERQARQMEQRDTSQHSEHSPSASEEEDDEEEEDREGGGSGGGGAESGEDMDVPVEVEDIPLTKPGYSTPPIYPPIQVQAAPAVQPPEIKDHPQEKTIGDGISIPSFEPLRPEEAALKREEVEKPESPQTATKLTFGLKKSSGSGGGAATLPPAKKAKLEKVFNPMEDEREKKTKKKLVPIDYSEEEEQAVGVVGGRRGSASADEAARKGSTAEEHKMGSEERKKMIQNLVNSIPTSKDDVFAYELKWEAIDKSLMEKRVGPWINKKIVEYIGEEEPTLRDFICNKLACHVSAQDILQDISMVLDDEAEVFVVKLWRLLIYETEARHMGIAKSY